MAPILDALNPSVGSGLVEKWMPLVVSVVTVGIAVAAIFGLVPEMDAVSGLSLLGGAGAGYAVRSQA